LHDILVQQGDISLPEIKETHYFSNDQCWKKGEDWYFSWFRGENKQLVGEVDPEYLYSETACERIKGKTSSPDFIVIVREPLSRAFSQYSMTKRRGYEKLSFGEALIKETHRLGKNAFDTEHFSYLNRGNYSIHIQKYLAGFPESRFLFLKFEDLIDESKRVDLLNNLFGFLNVRSSSDLQIRKKNPGSKPRSKYLRDMIHSDKKYFIKKVLRRIITNDKLKMKIALFVNRLNEKATNTQYDLAAVHSSLPDEIKEQINLQNQQTSRITGLDLSDWKWTNTED